ncbi:MAG: aminotransferase class I/II-fold pyridoxal phosphate-dependent enzyme [Acidaminococcaceae bacterium]|nr:aminotransferase class I/II-fold pyridoxal phosphate-dependent enzyme [Acidaminococcaceae bacterium]
MYKYSHGGNIYEPDFSIDKLKADFSANINPLGLPAGVKKAMQNAFSLCVNYPDAMCRELAAATAAFLDVPAENIFFGNGAADVLFRLATALKPKKALLLAPTFSDYEKALRTVACEIEYYTLKKENRFEVLEDIIDKITEDIDLVVICNPNNPTGQLCSQKILEAVLQKCRDIGAKFLVDECFMDFVPDEKVFSMKKYLTAFKELIILKAFTKTYAMPGVRLGYCLTSNSKLHTALHEAGQDWNVSVLAQAAGIAALQEEAYLKKSRDLINKERSFMLKEFSKLGFEPMGEANYIFFHAPVKLQLPVKLKQAGYLIRSCSNYKGLSDGYYRAAVKSRRDNRNFLKAVKDIVNDEITIAVD